MNTQKAFKIMKKAIKKYGVEKQLLICIEELSELIQAITKMERYPNDETRKNDLTEELTDVLICLDYLALIYEIDESKIDEIWSKKLKRLKERMKNEEN